MFKQTSQAIASNIDFITKDAVEKQYQLNPDKWNIENRNNYNKSVRDMGYHINFLIESMAVDSKILFLDYIAWVKVLFSGLEFPPSVLLTSLSCLQQSLTETLRPEEADTARNYIESAIEFLSASTIESNSFLIPKKPLFELASQYLSLILSGNRHDASRLILNSVEQGTSVKDIYLYVFQPCQQEIGRLWQTNQVNIAQEHFCSNTTQLIISQLYPHIFSSKKNGYHLLATAIGGELHEIGMRMVADFLEMDGWDTYYVGANTPNRSILQIIKDRQIDIVAISATITFHISNVCELVDQIRSEESMRKVKVIVGGYPFNISPNLWKIIGADGFAHNADEAVAMARQLMENNSQ